MNTMMKLFSLYEIFIQKITGMQYSNFILIFYVKVTFYQINILIKCPFLFDSS